MRSGECGEGTQVAMMLAIVRSFARVGRFWRDGHEALFGFGEGASVKLYSVSVWRTSCGGLQRAL